MALTWWNCGVVDHRPTHLARADDPFSQFRDGARALDPGGTLRSSLEAYVRGAGLWQQWVLFGPDAPHFVGRVELLGITGFDQRRNPVLDPEPLRTDADFEITERTQFIGNPPCGWTLGADPKAVFLRASYARYHGARARARRGRDYVGVQFLCRTRPVHRPGEEPERFSWSTDVLWAGPLPPPEAK